MRIHVSNGGIIITLFDRWNLKCVVDWHFAAIP